MKKTNRQHVSGVTDRSGAERTSVIKSGHKYLKLFR